MEFDILEMSTGQGLVKDTTLGEKKDEAETVDLLRSKGEMYLHGCASTAH